MSIDHSTATAKISLTGLALSCFNEATGNWEVALLRHPLHQLKITVNKMLPNGSSSQMTFDVDNQHKIFIKAENAIVPKENLFMDGPFDRKDRQQSNPEDIRWIVDLEHEFNQGKPLNLIRPELDVTEMFVSQPLLYADKHHVLNEMDLLKVSGPQPQRIDDAQPFGSVSEICHADLSCQKGGRVELRIEGPLGFEVKLPHLPGATHGIRIENLCDEHQGKAAGIANGVSDFSLYFDLVQLPNGARFDLKPRHQGQHGSDAVCNPILLGSRESLLPIS